MRSDDVDGKGLAPRPYAAVGIVLAVLVSFGPASTARATAAGEQPGWSTTGFEAKKGNTDLLAPAALGETQPHGLKEPVVLRPFGRAFMTARPACARGHERAGAWTPAKEPR